MGLDVIPSFVRHKTDNNDIEFTQDRISDFAANVSDKEILDGVLVDGVVFDPASLTVTVNHKLGRKPQGWFITDISAAATLYRSEWDNDTITLTASGGCTIDLWVF